MSPISSTKAASFAGLSGRSRERTRRSQPVFLFGALLAIAIIPLAVHAQAFLSDEPGREEVATNNPEILSKSDDIIARENSTVVLECDVKDQGEYVLLWKFTSIKTRKPQVLFADKIAIQASKYPAISQSNATNSKSIIIKHLTSDLVGSYTCEISTSTAKFIVYNVSVMTAPIIVPVPANGKTTIKKNGALRLECNVRPSPSPATFQWTHEDKVLDNNSPTLDINSVQSDNEGKYVCTAHNEIGDRQFTFNVAVQYEPEISISEKIIHGPIGDDVEVKCEVRANPRADIFWQFSNNSRVHNSNKHQIETHEKFSVLRIRNINLNDYDNYYCTAQNSIGTQNVFFEVTGRPSKAKFTSPDVGNDGDSYLLEWTVFSQSPIKAYDLKIREVDHSTDRRGEWRRYPMTPVNDGPGPVRKQSFRVENLSQFNSYEAKLDVMNDQGNTESDIFHFFSTDASSSSFAGLSVLSLCLSLLVLALFN